MPLVSLDRISIAFGHLPLLDQASLQIDAPSGEYATSGIQTAQMREFDLAWGSVAPGALQAAAAICSSFFESAAF